MCDLLAILSGLTCTGTHAADTRPPKGRGSGMGSVGIGVKIREVVTIPGYLRRDHGWSASVCEVYCEDDLNVLRCGSAARRLGLESLPVAPRESCGNATKGMGGSSQFAIRIPRGKWTGGLYQTLCQSRCDQASQHPAFGRGTLTGRKTIEV